MKNFLELLNIFWRNKETDKLLQINTCFLKHRVFFLRELFSHEFFISFYLVKPIKHIESKDFPGRYITIKRGIGELNDGDHHFLKIAMPGNTGKEGTISFQTSKNTWLMVNGSSIVEASTRNTRSFILSTTFVVYENIWFYGYVAFEPCINPRRFLKHDGIWLRISEFENSTDFQNSSSWVMLDRSKYFVRVLFWHFSSQFASKKCSINDKC